MVASEELLRRGIAAQAKGRWDEAESCYRRLLAARVDHPGVLNNLGLTLVARRQYAEAAEVFERSVNARPRATHTLVALANALIFINRPMEAIARCDEALAIDRINADARHNRAVALGALNRHDEAIVELESLLAADPGDADAEFKLALSELVLGRFESGWRHFEARWHGPKGTVRRVLPLASIASWRPGDALEGRRVLVQAEQGLGDALQFLRFVPRLYQVCRSVDLQVPAGLVALATRTLPRSRVGELAETIPGQMPDVRLPLLSLPLALGLNDEAAFAQPRALLDPEPGRVDTWRAMLPALARQGRKIGLAWRGNALHRNDHNRSIAIERLDPWLTAEARAGTTVVALQRDPTGPELKWLGRFADVHVPGEQLVDCEDTAAVCASLDEVVAVDSAVAHLAAGLGRPTAILLPFAPDWRWGLAGEASPWYPTARLLRQPAIGDWASVIGKLL